MYSLSSTKSFLSAIFCALAFPLIAGQGTSDSLSIVLAHENARSVLAFANQLAANDLTAATTAFDIAEQKSEGSAAILMDIWRDRGFALENFGHLEAALDFYAKALELSDKHNSDKHTLTLLNDLAIVSRKARYYEKAKNYHLRCLELATRQNDAEHTEYALHGLGYLYESVGDFAEALIYYEKSRTEAEKRNDIQGQIISLSNIAHAYIAQKDTFNALASILKAWQMTMDYSSLQRQAHVAFNYGEIQEKIGHLEEAKRMFKAALIRYASGEDKASEIEAAYRLARIYYRKNELHDAAEELQNIQPDLSVLSPELLAEVCLLYGKVALESKHFHLSKQQFLKAYQIGKNDSLRTICYSALRGLSQASEKLGEVEAALEYLETSNAYRVSYEEAQLTLDNKELNFRFGLEQTEMELQALQISQNRIQTITISILGLLIVAALGYILFFRKKNNRLLSEKNKEIREQNEQLESSNQFLQQFTYAVAHDMKEPLRTINGFTTLLERKYGQKFEQEGQAYLGFLRSGVERMHELVTSFLTFSSVTEQSAAFVEANADAALRDAKVELLNHFKNGEIVQTGRIGILRMNYDHLRHLFKQILQNGLKFNESNTPTIQVDVDHLDNGRTRIAFRDNGIGIKQEYESKIFNLFQQLNKDKGFGGVGIGLTMSKNIVEKYNGKIWFESETSLGGTVFYVDLPTA